MSAPYPVFPVGSVGHNLMLLRGTWHDHIELYNLDGTPLEDDSGAGSGSPGPGPFDNLVYIDFDGENFALTTASTLSWERPLTTTLQSRSRNCSARPRPIPRVLPVTTTVFIDFLTFGPGIRPHYYCYDLAG